MSGRTVTWPAANSCATIGEAQRVGRDVGIPAIGHAPWGTHFCQFYNTKQDLLDILAAFFRAGLQNNEACVWVTGDQWVAGGQVTVTEAIEAMRRSMPDADHYLDRGQIEITPYTDWYVSDGVFQQEQVLAGWNAKLERALERGYDGLRGSGTTFWLEKSDWRAFAEYEHTVDRLVTKGPLLGICTYSLEKCSSAEIFDVLKNHAFALVKSDDEWTLIEPSERKRATEAVERMNRALAERTAELQAALADLRGFSRWVSHDLRAPLRAISSFGKLLAGSSEERLTDRERHMLERIRQNPARMDNLITDILSYSTAQRTDVRDVPIDMEMLAHDVCDGMAESTGHDVELRVRTLPPTHGDPAMVSQALANLVGNALKFSRDTHGACVEVGARIIDGETTYYVRDNGVGFDMAHADGLFAAFGRLHGDKEFEGTGLGLAIVKQIITRHGGRVWADGSPNIGATFYFTLPGPGLTVSALKGTY